MKRGVEKTEGDLEGGGGAGSDIGPWDSASQINMAGVGRTGTVDEQIAALLHFKQQKLVADKSKESSIIKAEKGRETRQQRTARKSMATDEHFGVPDNIGSRCSV